MNDRNETIKGLMKIKSLKTLTDESKMTIDEAIYYLKADAIHEVLKVVADKERSKADLLRIMFNRCMAQFGTSGMCAFCGLKNECNEYRSVLKEERTEDER